MTDPTNIDSEASLTLSVGWKSGQKTKLRQLTVGDDVAEALRDVVRATLDNLEERTPENWAPDADLSPETYLTIDSGELGDAPALASEHVSASLFELLVSAESLENLDPNELPAADMGFYVVTIGDDPGHRAAFLRRTNPRRGLRSGKIWTSYHDVLTRIDEPVFAFDDLVDLVFYENQVSVLSQTAFVALFRSQETLAAQVPLWTKDLSTHVSISAEGADRLVALALRNSRAKARLEAIVRRGHLADVSAEVIKTKLEEVGLDVDTLLDEKGQMVFANDNEAMMALQFLNEDLFVGTLTRTGFRADKKAAR